MSASDHVRRDRGLGELEPQLEQFTMDAGSAPQRVLFAHSSDQIAQVAIYPRPYESLRPAVLRCAVALRLTPGCGSIAPGRSIAIVVAMGAARRETGE